MAKRMVIGIAHYGHEVTVYPRDIADNMPEGTDPGSIGLIEAHIRDYVHEELETNPVAYYINGGMEEVVEAVQSLLEERNNGD